MRWAGAVGAPATSRCRTCTARPATTIPFWRMAPAPVDDTAGASGSDRRSGRSSVRSVTSSRCPAPDRHRARRSRPAGIVLDGDRLAELRLTTRRSWGASATAARCSTCARSTADDDVIVARLSSADFGDESRRHRRSRRPRQVVARAGAHRHRPRPLRGGEATRAHDRPRVRPHDAAVGRRRSASSTCRATSGSCPTCSPASVPSTPACSSLPPPRAGSRSPRSICASSSCSGPPTA